MQRLTLKYTEPSEIVEDPLQTASEKKLLCVIFCCQSNEEKYQSVSGKSSSLYITY